MKFWENLKQKAKESEEMKQQIEEGQRKFSEDIRRIFEEQEEEKRANLDEVARRIYAEYLEELILYCKENLRIGEFEAETVGIFYYSLADERRAVFLRSFTEEEKEVIDFQLAHLKNYTEDAVKEVLQQVANELHRRRLEK